MEYAVVLTFDCDFGGVYRLVLGFVGSRSVLWLAMSVWSTSGITQSVGPVCEGPTIHANLYSE